MGPEIIFQVCNNGVIPAWLLLALAPGWVWTQRIVHGVWIPALLACVYGWLLFFGEQPDPGGNFFSLEGVMLLFQTPSVLVAGWIHYLVFDLFVGAWQVRDARRRGIHHLLVVPCLFSTLMFGPLGLLLYLALRFLKLRVTTLTESNSPA